MARRSNDDPDVTGVLLIDKPAGLTSHDVVGRVRRAVGVRRVGHSGTLDPPATGLMLVGVGWITRVLRFTGIHPKTYDATIAFGTETSTYDATGDIVSRVDMNVGIDAFAHAAKDFIGPIEQIPPMVSAIKIGGDKLYELARRGVEVEREPRLVTIESIDLIDIDERSVTVRVKCSSGTYIRSLAHDLGRALGGCAHLAELRRVAIGPHSVADAIDLDALGEVGRGGLLPASVAVAGMPSATVDADDAVRVMTGSPLDLGPIESPTPILDPSGALIAMYRPGTPLARPECVAPIVAQHRSR